MKKYPLLKKSLAFTIVVLFIVSCVIPSTGLSIIENFLQLTTTGNTLYVGGSGLEDYDKIQDAIDNASDGDTVFVHNDSSPYYENIYIEKSINLIGEDRNTTIIDGNKYGNVVSVFSYKKVLISGFTIQNSGNYTSPYAWADAGLSLWGSYTIIVGNNILNNLCGVHLYCSHDNNISGNVISSNECGIYLPPSLGYCERNIISGNVIRDNDKGICMKTPENNYIFQNNFINNTLYNAHDSLTDFWDGNYWDDYNGTDENHDGIGDTPYLIPGHGSNQDYYPLMYPWVNSPPCIPLITGLTNGKARRMYNYTFNATDHNGNSIYYCIDWGDNTISGWVEPFPSGQKMFAMHSWHKGNYIIRAKAKDIYGAESDWSTLSVTMPRTISFNPMFLKLLERFPHAFPILRYILDFN
jgi:parallel beta-helix repeat protein